MISFLKSIFSVLVGVMIAEIGQLLGNQTDTLFGIEKYQSEGYPTTVFIYSQLMTLSAFYIFAGMFVAFVVNRKEWLHVAIVVSITLILLLVYSLSESLIQPWYYWLRATIVIGGLFGGCLLVMTARNKSRARNA